MADTISLTGFGIADPVPGNVVEVNFAAGGGSTAAQGLSVLLLGSKSAAGSAVLDTVYGPDTLTQLISADTADLLFGPGSEAARMCKMFYRANPSTRCYAAAITPGESAIAAEADVVITGTATANGSIRYSITKADWLEIGFEDGETATTIGDRLEEAVNAKTDWPFTASNAAGTVTMTAKCLGPRGNQIRHIAQVLPITPTGITITPTSSTAFTGGLVNDDVQTLLDSIVTRRFSYIVAAHADSSNITAIATHIATLALPINGLRQRMIVASVDTLAGALAIAAAQNFSREELVWFEECDQGTGVLAAQMAAIYTSGESVSPIQCSFDSYPLTDSQRGTWFLTAPLSEEMATRSETSFALDSGVTPIAVDDRGNAYLVRRITTKFLVNALPNYTARDAHKVSVPDRYADDLLFKLGTLFPQKVIQDDPPDNAPPARNAQVVYVRNIRAAVNELTTSYGPGNGLSLIGSVPQTIAETVVERSTNASRVNVSVPLRVVDCLHQTASQINQVA